MAEDILNADDGEGGEQAEREAERRRGLARDMHKGREARSIVDSPLFSEYFDHARAQVIDQLKKLGVKQDEERWRLVTALSVMDKMQGFMASLADKGEFSEKQLRELESPTGRRKFF